MPQFHTLRLILGDQLNEQHSWFADKDPGVLYLIAELVQETVYVQHHVQKLAAFFAAMQTFSNTLSSAGHHVLHLTLDDTAAYQSLPELLEAVIKQHQIEKLVYQRPDEYRLAEQLRLMSLPVPCHQVESEHFLLPFDEIGKYFKPGKHLTMERFYRQMRQRFDVLMEHDKPLGGRWNYDQENRAKLDASGLAEVPAPLLFGHDIRDILARLGRHQVKHFGKSPRTLTWPVSRSQALQLLDYFCVHGLPQFGRYQDAMTDQHPHAWSLYHSRLSFALNSKMLSPKEVIDQAVFAYHASQGAIDLAQIEGFVRQILGWREYMRGVYWANMPSYRQQNVLHASRTLPTYFWSGRTKMNCVHQAVQQSLEHAYAHHIQRLMITGNFCLLTGIDPDQVDAWYLGVYIDAIEWVELPNTRGMSQFADGGLVATKPYVSSGSYINRMSDYCKSCHYKPSVKTGKQACPFNSLYWHFMHRHRDQLGKIPRLGMVYKSWQRMDNAKRDALLAQAEAYLMDIESL